MSLRSTGTTAFASPSLATAGGLALGGSSKLEMGEETINIKSAHQNAGSGKTGSDSGGGLLTASDSSSDAKGSFEASSVVQTLTLKSSTAAHATLAGSKGGSLGKAGSSSSLSKQSTKSSVKLASNGNQAGGDYSKTTSLLSLFIVSSVILGAL